MGMDRDIKREWITALESGGYTQGKHYLKSESGYCCLGVLCDVMGLELVEKNGGPHYGVRDPKVDPDSPTNLFINASVIPSTFTDPIGLPMSAQTKLADLNDKGLTFKAIAEHIRRTL